MNTLAKISENAIPKAFAIKEPTERDSAPFRIGILPILMKD